MKIKHIDYINCSQLSKKDQDYINLNPYLNPFYSYIPDLSYFDKVIKDRKKYKVDRAILHKVLMEDYSNKNSTPLQFQQIDSLLSENTWTVTTAHQPNLLGGPLYYILKIASTINLSRQLTNSYTDQHIIPLFINGSEDHDFDEINNFNLYKKNITWYRESKGPVGRLSIDGLEEVLAKTKEILGENDNINNILKLFEDSLYASRTYNDFVFRWVTSLFADTELLVISMDKHELKKNFTPILEEEILKRPSEKIILDTQQQLTKHGFKPQAHPRDINLFYIGSGDRKRITYEAGKYHIVGSDLYYTESEILSELHKSPENFSPNVIMRPIYQEFSLPNLAYIGGGGEIAYWLERKKQFEHYNVFYPMLIRRNSAVLINNSDQKQIQNLDLTEEKLFDKTDNIINYYLNLRTKDDISINNEKSQIEEAYRAMADKAEKQDKTVASAILAEMTKHLKNIDNLGNRIKRSVKTREEVNINRIHKLKERLFPDAGLQERNDNFLQFYSSLGPEILDFLIDNLDPLDRRFSIILT